MKELQQFVDEHRVWALATFGKTPETAPLHHLKKEVDELIDGIENRDQDNKIEEYADCFILLLHAADKSGLSMENLLFYARNKFERNKMRKWGPVDDKGVSEHIR
jgi:NTP pyrophosphatase (non-canonical NTP hydrolase)